MLKISSETIIYVLCPAYLTTGGAELAHQLVYMINRYGGNALIAYYDRRKRPIKITDAYKKYVENYVELSNIVDSSDNIIVSPENNPEHMNQFHFIQKCVWWMSVDNYLFYHSIPYVLKNYDLKTALKHLIKGPFHHLKTKMNNNQVHFYQSEYARRFILNMKINNPIRLSDYLNEEYLNVDINTERKNVVLYNPKKGFSFTQKLINIAPDINWLPLQNMTTEQVKETLLHSKVYIDFGNHPGKDRFPREAAACGCCVITGKRGSANFFEDVPIDEEFKYDENKALLKDIVAKIRECLMNYEMQSKKFDGYREFIKGEYKVFQDDVKSIFILGDQNVQKSTRDV